jgi:hypothetical protein
MASLGPGSQALTPTLSGRWQTRLFLLTLLGVPLTFIFGYLYSDFMTPLALLGYILLLGFLWDIVYNALQTLRWDRDWPPLFFVIGGLFEGLFLWDLTYFIVLPGVDPQLTFGRFAAHYSTVFLFTLVVMLGPLKVIFLKWRFRGGRLI